MSKSTYDPYSALNQKLIDGAIVGLSCCLAYRARFEGHIPTAAAYQMWVLLPLLMTARVLVNLVLGAYRMIWRYVSLADAVTLTRNYAVVSAALLAIRYLAPSPFGAARIPLSVILLEYSLSLGGALGVRALRRFLFEGITSRALNGAKATRVLFIGAGRAGVMVAKEIRSRVDLRPVGFLDDNPKKVGSTICGLRVLGPLNSLAAAIQERSVQEVIVCIARPPRQALKRIWATCEHLSIPVKIVPTLEEILGTPASIAKFRNVEMKDLLGREPVELPVEDQDLVSVYSDKCILVTGAGGSIGSELAWQLAALGPKRLVLLDKDENGLNDTYIRLRAAVDGVAIAVVADLRFTERLRGVFAAFHPDVVFHAAAHKHVHLMEINPCEAIANNVTGTRNLVEQSLAFDVSLFVQISTDKAVNPTSIMGASKRVCESIVQSQRQDQGTRFCCVRFGNVLGSRGSVIPIFQKQIRQGGPITLTHPEAQRFLMTISEAVCLLIEAGSLACDGETFVLDMGEPVLIQNLAHDLIELSGLQPNRDVRIQVTRMHAGEKLSEALVDDVSETLKPTRFAKIRMITGKTFDAGRFMERVRVLEKAATLGRTGDVYAILRSLEIGFRAGPETTVPINVSPEPAQSQAVGV